MVEEPAALHKTMSTSSTDGDENARLADSGSEALSKTASARRRPSAFARAADRGKSSSFRRFDHFRRFRVP
jgi:hypothetical protein